MPLKLTIKLKLPPRPALPGANDALTAQVNEPTGTPLVVHSAPTTSSDRKRKEPEDPHSCADAKRQHVDGIEPPAPKIIRKITLKRPVGDGSVMTSMPAPLYPSIQQGQVQQNNKAQRQMDKWMEKKAQDQQKQLDKEQRQQAKAAAEALKVQQKHEAAQEKLRQKQEVEQEKKRAQDQANIVKRITLKIVSGSGGPSRSLPPIRQPVTAMGDQEAQGGEEEEDVPEMTMAPSDMFLATTGNRQGPGKHFKPKIKLGNKGAAMQGNKRPVGRPPGTGTGRPVGRPPGSGAAGILSPRQYGPSDRANLEKILGKIQSKDVKKIFWKPVTEALAPNYFSVIKQPMDFTTMRSKLAAGHYQTWDDMQADLDLIFTNCMTYNPIGVYYLEAKKMQEVARRLVDLGRKGETNFRGRTAGIVKSHNATILAELHKQQELQPLGRGMRHHGGIGADGNPEGAPSQPHRSIPGIRALQACANVQHPTGPRNRTTAPDFHMLLHGVAAKPVRGGRGGRGPGMGIIRRPSAFNPQHLADASMDGDVRQTYRPRAAAPQVPFASWGALSNGVSPEGLPWANGKPTLVPSLLDIDPSQASYLASIGHFVSRCSPALRKFAMKKVVACVPVEGIVLPPEPPSPPPEPITQPVSAPPPRPSMPPKLNVSTSGPTLNLGVAANAQSQHSGLPTTSSQQQDYLKQALSLLQVPNNANAQMALANILMQQAAKAGGGQPSKTTTDALASFLQQQANSNVLARQKQQQQQQQQIGKGGPVTQPVNNNSVHPQPNSFLAQQRPQQGVNAPSASTNGWASQQHHHQQQPGGPLMMTTQQQQQQQLQGSSYQHPAPTLQPQLHHHSLHQQKMIAPAQPQMMQAAQPQMIAPTQPQMMQAAQPQMMPMAQPQMMQAAQPQMTPVAQPQMMQAAQPHMMQAAQPQMTPVAQPQMMQAAQPQMMQVAQSQMMQAAQPQLMQSSQPQMMQSSQPHLTSAAPMGLAGPHLGNHQTPVNISIPPEMQQQQQHQTLQSPPALVPVSEDLPILPAATP